MRYFPVVSQSSPELGLVKVNFQISDNDAGELTNRDTLPRSSLLESTPKPHFVNTEPDLFD